MKKLLCMLLALTMVLSLCAPAFAEESHTITGEDIPLYTVGQETGETMKLYFLDGVKDLPYMEISDLCDLLTGLIGDGIVTFTKDVQGPVVTITRNHEGSMDDGCHATFDFDKSEIRFVDYNIFTMKPDASTILDVTSIPFFTSDGRPALIQKVDKGTFDRYGDELVLPLADYDIELIYQPVENGLYLIPLQTLNDFFFAPNGVSFFYNGQCVNLSAEINPGDALYYAAPTGERSEALTKYGYGELCMDGHSSWHGFSYLTGDLDYTAPKGPSESKWSQQRDLYASAREKFYPDGIPGYEEVGNTAYVTFDKFELPQMMNTAEYIYSVEDPADLPDNDTIGLIIKAHSMITREGSPIENVVLDLSVNQGGAADTAVFVIAWFLGEANIGMKDTMTGAVCASTYRCDANRDHEFDERDTVQDKNLFVLTSPVGFSCGNLVPCALKDSGMVTVMGRTSGGGSCVVQKISSAWGTSFQILLHQKRRLLRRRPRRGARYHHHEPREVL